MADPRIPASVDQFRAALRSRDGERVRALLESDPDVRAAVNAPIGHFGGRPLGMVRDNLPLVDLLLSYGADLNLKSDWGPGGFGLLESGCSPEQAAPLIARGAIVDIFAAANLLMLDRVRELVDADPSLVHARGGDGRTALHCARTVPIAEFLLERGAAIDARCVDHQSTAAQYLVREVPDVTRMLVQRGAWFDIFIAVGLGDTALIERCLREDPGALDHRTGHGLYRTVDVGNRPPTVGEIGTHRGDVYRWVFDHNVTALDVAYRLGDRNVVATFVHHATARQLLLAACWRSDREAAEAIVAANPGLVSTLTPEQHTLIADAAHADNAAAVALMLDLGFDPLARGVDQWEAVRWAAFHGNVPMLKRLLAHNPPIGVPDPSYGGTPIGQCVYGSLHGWNCRQGDFATAVRLLLDAGERPDRSWYPTGRADVDAVLGSYFS